MPSIIVVIIVVLLWPTQILLAQECPPSSAYEQALALEATFQKLTHPTIAKTVLIKTILRGLATYMGTGSGALISPDGYILTCAHVVASASKIVVVLSDGRYKRAKIIKLDNRYDRALLKIPAKNLPYFQWGNSQQLRVGDWVIALGHPGGPSRDLRPSFAVGRVRAFNIHLQAQQGRRLYPHALRTDVPIYSGNSGGPLVDLTGALLGINAAIQLNSESAYAIPIEDFQSLLPSGLRVRLCPKSRKALPPSPSPAPPQKASQNP